MHRPLAHLTLFALLSRLPFGDVARPNDQTNQAKIRWPSTVCQAAETDDIAYMKQFKN